MKSAPDNIILLIGHWQLISYLLMSYGAGNIWEYKIGNNNVANFVCLWNPDCNMQ